MCAPVPSIAPLYCSPFTSYGTGIYAGTAASNFNAINTAKAEMKDKYPDGYVTNIFGKPVKFNDEDITQLLNLFKQNK